VAGLQVVCAPPPSPLTLIDTQSPSDSNKLLPYDCVAALIFASSSRQVRGASSCRLHLRLLEQRWLSWRQPIRVPHVRHGRWFWPGWRCSAGVGILRASVQAVDRPDSTARLGIGSYDASRSSGRLLCPYALGLYPYHVLLLAAAQSVLQIIDYMAGKLLEAESVRAKRLYLTRIVNAAQVTLGLLSLVAVGLVAAAGAYNLLAANAFLESAAAFRGGDNVTAARLGTRASAVNDTGDNYQGVSV
jgi:hypothetical protein